MGSFEFFVNFNDLFWYIIKTNLIWVLFNIPAVVIGWFVFFKSNSEIANFYLTFIALVIVLFNIFILFKLHITRREDGNINNVLKGYCEGIKLIRRNIKDVLVISVVQFLLYFMKKTPESSLIQGGLWLVELIINVYVLGAVYYAILDQSNLGDGLRQIALSFLGEPTLLLLMCLIILCAKALIRFIPIGLLFFIPSAFVYVVVFINDKFLSVKE